jgi:hypothetical protein
MVSNAFATSKKTPAQNFLVLNADEMVSTEQWSWWVVARRERKPNWKFGILLLNCVMVVMRSRMTFLEIYQETVES